MEIAAVSAHPTARRAAPVRWLPGLILATWALAAGAAVGPLPATDAELAAAVREALSRDPALGRLGLQVEATDGTIRLEGNTPTLALRREAVRLTAAERGVLAVEDLLSLPQGPADRTVALRVANRLSPYADLRSPVLETTVEEGRVRVLGRVGTVGRLLFLDKLVASVEGVAAIDLSGVEVESFATASRDDARIQEAVFSLIRNPLVFPVAGRVEVAVAGGDVTLTGTVPRLIDRMEAEMVAWLVGGVTGVANEIQVDPGLGRNRVREPGP